MKPIASKNLGVNKETGLEESVSVWAVNINAKSERIQIGYIIETISPTGVVIKESEMQFYIRQNVTANEEQGIEENMKFDALRDSQIGKAISAMIKEDLKDYPNF